MKEWCSTVHPDVLARASCWTRSRCDVESGWHPICKSPQKDLAAAGLESRELGKMEAFFAGGTARGVAAAATVPFTIVKTRMEYQGASTQIHKVLTALRIDRRTIKPQN